MALLNVYYIVMVNLVRGVHCKIDVIVIITITWLQLYIKMICKVDLIQLKNERSQYLFNSVLLKLYIHQICVFHSLRQMRRSIQQPNAALLSPSMRSRGLMAVWIAASNQTQAWSGVETLRMFRRSLIRAVLDEKLHPSLRRGPGGEAWAHRLEWLCPVPRVHLFPQDPASSRHMGRVGVFF